MDILRFKLTIAYDGTAYHGWQAQKSGRGIQNHVESALSRLFLSSPLLTGSSRTDAGVHAFGLVAHFDLPAARFRMPERHLALAINACLPGDIRVRSAVIAPPDFHARFSAIGKQYRYQVWNHPVMNPLLRHQAWHVPTPLDLPAMREASSHFPGTHDFRSFTANRGAALEDAVRTVTRCEIKRRGLQLTFIIEGGGFLYKMCRGIVGTLVQVGEGKHSAASVPGMFSSRNRPSAGMNAPALGLTLWKVRYP